MKIGINPLRSIMALALGAAVLSAYAASGYSVTPDQEKLVKIGMTKAEVQSVIGRRSHSVKFRNQSGPTWVYQVNGGMYEDTYFDVDFGADGKVVSAGEMVNIHQGHPMHEE